MAERRWSAIPFDREELKRRIKCPTCCKPMDTHPLPRRRKRGRRRTCDRCASAVWLDAGEMTRTGAFPTKAPPTPTYIPPAEPGVRPAPRPVVHVFGFPITFDDVCSVGQGGGGPLACQGSHQGRPAACPTTKDRIHSTNSSSTGFGIIFALCASSNSRRIAARRARHSRASSGSRTCPTNLSASFTSMSRAY